MPHAEFLDWLAYDEMSPLDLGFRSDLMTAQLTCLLYNCHAGKNDKLKLKRFYPPWFNKMESPEQKVARMKASLVGNT